ncbi:MAG: formimidoylglutamate deiminase [Ilumatobacteraceae bacterium]
MATFHCALAWLGGDRADADVLVTVDGDRISAVKPGVSAPPDATRLRGLTLPGLANAHSHAFHRALRSRTQAGSGSFWTWRDQMYALAARLDPESYYALARATFAEMALAGITCVGEFHYLHHQADGVPYADPNAMGAAVLAAAADVGLRITLLETCYKGAGLRAPNPIGVQHRFADQNVMAWAERAAELRDGTAVRIGAAIHSVRAVDPWSIEQVAAWSADRTAPLHAHVSEQRAENEECLEVLGRTPMQMLADRHALTDRFTAVHATHASEADLDLLGAAGGWCCLCPTTERDLADGIGAARAMRDSGVRLTLGSDSNAVIDLLEEARAIELDERLASGVRGSHDAASLLRAATVGGHASLGWPDGGRIEVGALADLTTISLDSVRTVGTSAENALDVAVFAATSSDVRHVVIGGRVVVADGQHATIDVAAELGAVLTDP